MVAETHDQAAAKQQELDNEMVPLAVASSVTYFHLTELTKQVGSHENLAERLQVVCVALSQVAPIYRAPQGDGSAPQLSNREVDELLLRPARDGGEPPRLDAFCIRRGDLRKALVALREARNPFGK